MLCRPTLFLLVGALISCAAWAETKPVEMVVLLKSAKTIIVRAMPDQESNAIASIENGKSVLRKGSEETNGFVMVQLADGRTGWTKSAFLFPTAARVVTTSVPEPIVVPTPAEHEQIVKPVMVQSRANYQVVSAKVDGSISPATGRDGEAEISNMWSMKLWGIGLIGMLIGLLIGGKIGMVYATRYIHERYVVID